MAVLTPRLRSPNQAQPEIRTAMDVKRRVKIREYGEQQLEALGHSPSMEFELDDGHVIELTHPWLWSDDIQTAYDKVRFGADLDRDKDGNIVDPPQVGRKPAEPQSVRLARAALGKEAHKKFIAGGGKSNQIVLAIELMKQRDTSTGEAETDPKDKQS